MDYTWETEVHYEGAAVADVRKVKNSYTPR
jgi:hypothetical protein